MKNELQPEQQVEVHYAPHRRQGSEQIPGLTGKTLADYWAWAYSDIMENVQRAIYAEFLVACALDLDHGVRVGWRSYDLKYGDWRIEVKASGYIQSWQTTKPSKILFGVGKRLEIDPLNSAFGTVKNHYADVWVFALFEPIHYAPDIDVVDADRWRFYVVHNTALEAQILEGQIASLATIEKLASPVRHAKLKAEIDRVLEAVV